MAKKIQKTASSRRFPFSLIFVVLFAAGVWWLWESPELSNWKEGALQYIDNRDITTLEARFLPEQIIQDHVEEILGKDKKTLKNSVLRYEPYLLLDVKYPDEQHKIREGVLLWGLKDGEMVINTETWETTHGFRDCLECKASRSDFKILQALAKKQGSLSLDDLQKELHLEREVLVSWIESAKQKHLIVQKGNLVQLHFENPKLLVSPQTQIKHPLVSKSLMKDERESKVYSHRQIMQTMQAAFGSDFKIRSEQEIYLPIYQMEVLNPDGSIQFSQWNALTGQKINPRYLSKGF